MSSEPAASSTSKIADTKKAEQAKEDEGAQPHLGALEEDDEFEEFPVAGAPPTARMTANPLLLTGVYDRLG
jgi:26 proteasome complex subunit DSS1